MLCHILVHLVEVALSLHEHLTCNAKLLCKLHNLLVVRICMVNIHKDTVLAAKESFAESRNLYSVGNHIVSTPHSECHKRVIGNVAYLTFTVGHSIYSLVMHEDEHTVLCHLHVKLHHVHTHADD